MYRTKIYNKLYNDLLIPILTFLGLYVKEDKLGNMCIQWIGEFKKNEKGEMEPTYLTNPHNDNKKYILINSQEGFIKFKSLKGEMDYFNPFIRYKNALSLLLMCVPSVYGMIYDSSDDDLASLIVDDDINSDTEDMFKKISIKQYPVYKDELDVPWYKYSIEMVNPNNHDVIDEVSAIAKTKIVAIIMLICKIMDLFEETPSIISSGFEGRFDDFQLYLEEMLEKYLKERELNRKDLKKIKVETMDDMDLSGTDTEDDIYANGDVETILNSSDNNETFEENERSKVISLSDEYKDLIPICLKETDDDAMALDYF